MPEIAYGLKGVFFSKTKASFIDGEVGKLLYRGYSIHDLAQHSTYEETVFLLINGRLPTREELEKFDRQLRANREIPAEVIQTIRLVKNAHPMDVLRTAVSALSAFDPDVEAFDWDGVIRKGLRLTAQAATIVAAHHRIRQGLEPIPPDPKLGHAANFLKMLFGKDPDPDDARTMDVDFVLHAEHGPNASAFAAHVCASTLSDLHSAIVAGIATLKGPWHGGAAESVMKMVEDIGSPDRVDQWVKARLDAGERIMGFGHRVYKAEDPRARHLRERARDMGERRGQPQWFLILQKLYEAMRPYQARGIFVNVDFYAGSVYTLLGIPDDLFVPIFAVGRVPGWVLQVWEQYEDAILIRPLSEYDGPMDLEYVPIEKRGPVPAPAGR